MSPWRKKAPALTAWALVLIWLLAPGSGAAATFDHSAWDRLLARHVDDRGRVDYRALKRNGKSQLDAYLRALAAADPTSFPSDQERIAFWINAYNAVTVRQVLDHYPIGSVREVGILYAFFRRADYAVAGKKRTLDEIEKTLQREFREPRIHFAIVCASASCPKLQARAYTGAGLARQLDRATREFLQDPAKNHWDNSTRTLKLSSIFKWYKQDFEPLGGVLGFIRPYLDAPTLHQLDAGPYSVRYLPYDWNLNDQQARR